MYVMRLVFALALLAAACGGGGDFPNPDGGDGDGDAGELAAGISIEIESNPVVPSSFDSGSFDPELDSVRIKVVDVRIVGDAMLDPVGEVELRWEERELEVINFENAPIGRYSRVRATIEEFRADGELDIEDDREDWEINDEPPSGIPIDLAINADLEPGQVVKIRLRADFASVFNAVDWDSLEVDDDDGVIVGEGSSEIDAVRTAVAAMFSVAVQ